MSEYQYVYFAAVDSALNDEQLEFMQQQSTRAEISRWEFSNEYNFGNFRGDAEEMLRRGFDVHLHYANFGIRKLMFRLPAGLPWSEKTFAAYCPEYGLDWQQDKKGPGGILEINPEADAGTYDEGWWDFDHLRSGLSQLRERFIVGDLRPLYIVWLACTWDEEESEPPVPAGLGDLPKELAALAEFYEVDIDLLAAAAEGSASAPKSDDAENAVHKWLAKQSKAELRQLVERMLTEDATSVRAETLAAMRSEVGVESWPTSESTRTIGELRALAESQEARRRERAAKERERAREKRLAEIAADPAKTIAEAKQLVKNRTTSDYDKAAKCLADLREALGQKAGTKKATAVAEQLVKQNPTLHRLKSALRKQGLIPK